MQYLGPISVHQTWKRPLSSCHVIYIFFSQWTVSGVSGETGNHVQRHVVLEYSNVCARVPDHAQLLAGKIALVPVERPNRAKQGFVQVNTHNGGVETTYLEILNAKMTYHDSLKNNVSPSFAVETKTLLFFSPVDGQWSEWKPWTECTRSCGGGIQTRARTCTNPSPAHGGKDCIGRGNEARPCGSDACPGELSF